MGELEELKEKYHDVYCDTLELKKDVARLNEMIEANSKLLGSYQISIIKWKALVAFYEKKVAMLKELLDEEDLVEFEKEEEASLLWRDDEKI